MSFVPPRGLLAVLAVVDIATQHQANVPSPQSRLRRATISRRAIWSRCCRCWCRSASCAAFAGRTAAIAWRSRHRNSPSKKFSAQRWRLHTDPHPFLGKNPSSPRSSCRASSSAERALSHGVAVGHHRGARRPRHHARPRAQLTIHAQSRATRSRQFRFAVAPRSRSGLLPVESGWGYSQSIRSQRRARGVRRRIRTVARHPECPNLCMHVALAGRGRRLSGFAARRSRCWGAGHGGHDPCDASDVRVLHQPPPYAPALAA